MSMFDILVVDDDEDVIRQLKELLPRDIAGRDIKYHFLTSFDDAVSNLNSRRYDILVSDIYIAADTKHKKPLLADVRARELVEVVRAMRACPIILFTDGELPEEFQDHIFVSTIDKGSIHFPGNLGDAIEAAFATGIPDITKGLHDELDRFAGSFVWDFLENKWQQLHEDAALDHAALERVIRRRAALQFGRIVDQDGRPAEREHVDPADYYVMPPIGAHLRLGELLRNRGDGSVRVVLTPHCHLVVQPNAERPRAEYILTLKTVLAATLLGQKPWGADPRKKLRSRVALPAHDVGLPEERYCFLPGFLDVPDLYCDLMQTEALLFDQIGADWERIAVLDAPYAEALQAAFARFFGAVGVPNLNLERLLHLTA
jgi:CheY-like chemotaxis protein